MLPAGDTEATNWEEMQLKSTTFPSWPGITVQRFSGPLFICKIPHTGSQLRTIHSCMHNPVNTQAGIEALNRRGSKRLERNNKKPGPFSHHPYGITAQQGSHYWTSVTVGRHTRKHM